MTLLLLLVRLCGPSLRSDDPAGVKELIVAVHSSHARAGASLTKRGELMLEALYAMKNNLSKKGRQTDAALPQEVQVRRGGRCFRFGSWG